MIDINTYFYCIYKLFFISYIKNNFFSYKVIISKIIKNMTEKQAPKREPKNAIELDALNNEIIKRDNKFYSINKNFHLDLKTRMKI